MLGTAQGQAVSLASADVERGKSRAEALGGVAETARRAVGFAYGISRAVAGEDEGRRLAVGGIGVGEAENSLTLRPLLAVEDFVRRRARYLAEIIEFYLKKYLNYIDKELRMCYTFSRSIILL